MQAKIALLQQTLDHRDAAVKDSLEKMVCRPPSAAWAPIPANEGVVLLGRNACDVQRCGVAA
jgi:hypothetical protein